MSDLLDDATSASSGDDARSPKPRIWQSLSEFEGKLPAQGDAPSDEVANFVGREFPTDDFDQLDPVDRREGVGERGCGCMVVGQSVDVVLHCVHTGGGDDSHLTESAPEHLSPLPGL